MSYALGVLVSAVVWLPVLFWKAYVVSLCWKWFAVPLGAFDLTMLQAAGVIMLIKAFGNPGKLELNKDVKIEDTITSYLGALLYPLITLIFAAIIKFVVM